MRRFGLAGRFAVLSAVAVTALGVVLARVETSQIRRRALEDATSATQVLAQVGIQPHLRPSDLVSGINTRDIAELDSTFQAGVAQGSLARVKVWTPSGQVIYSDDHSLIGQTFPVSSDLREALEGHVSADVSSLDAAENVAERRFGQLLEVYIPLRFEAGPPAGAFEIYIPYVPIARSIATDTRHLYLIILVGLALLWGSLSKMVLTASRRMKHDADELSRRADENEYLALHDQLTGLPNRLLFRDRLEQSIRAADRTSAAVGVLVMDIDRFKEINDALGQDVGDQLLKQVGPRLGSILRKSDTVARLGGDEFGIVVGELGGATDAEDIASKIRASLRIPFELEDLPVEAGASIGLALYPDHGDAADELIRRADVAMYVAKGRNARIAVYSSDQDTYTRERLTLLSALRRAVEGGEIRLHYQPKVALDTGQVIGVEALARWSDGERGNVPPDVFVPLAEQAGLIRPLTSLVLRSAIRQAKSWADAGLYLKVAINVSTRDLEDRALPAQVVGLLEDHGLTHDSIQLEITEGAAMERSGAALDVMQELSRAGIALSIDDFGTGYSSLAYLQRLPVRELKVDRSFVTDLASSENDMEIVRSTLSMAHSLGLTVVAEGVEDGVALGLLREMGCDVAQGYHIARPMPAVELKRWLSANEPSGAGAIPTH
jgi:diguanylate cyclase (GGDEF)-like protein